MYYLLDGSWYLFRSYYALPDMKNSKWEDIWAIYWFFRMILKLLQDNPEKFVIAWDMGSKTKRHEKFPKYKANRPKIPNEFKNQIWVIKSIIKELNIPFFWLEWYEADDVINTIAQKYNWNIKIISSDKDLKQLLNDKIIFFDPVKQIIENNIDFEKNMWFPPINIIDYLALLWDTSDNIPWVKWIWKKTASELIQKYYCIENIYININEIKESISKKLIEWKDSAFESKSLIELMIIPNIPDVNELWKINIDFDKLKNILIQEYNFKSMEKIIDNLKLSYKFWTQTSLF